MARVSRGVMDRGVVGRGLGRVETGMLAEMAFQVSPWFASSLPDPATADGFTSTCRRVSWTPAVLPPIFGFVKRYSVGFAATISSSRMALASGATPGLRPECGKRSTAVFPAVSVGRGEIGRDARVAVIPGRAAPVADRQEPVHTLS